MMNIKKLGFIALTTGIIMLGGCNKDFDSPTVAALPEGNVISIDSLRNIYTFFDSTFVDDISVYGTVTADEVSGNLYKSLYIQDGENAILLMLTASSSKSFFIGDNSSLFRRLFTFVISAAKFSSVLLPPSDQKSQPAQPSPIINAINEIKKTNLFD